MVGGWHRPCSHEVRCTHRVHFAKESRERGAYAPHSAALSKDRFCVALAYVSPMGASNRPSWPPMEGKDITHAFTAALTKGLSPRLVAEAEHQVALGEKCAVGLAC